MEIEEGPSPTEHCLDLLVSLSLWVPGTCGHQGPISLSIQASPPPSPTQALPSGGLGPWASNQIMVGSIVQWLKSHTLEPDILGSHPSPTIYILCDLGQGISPLWPQFAHLEDGDNSAYHLTWVKD